jgi:hypothetical protein
MNIPAVARHTHEGARCVTRSPEGGGGQVFIVSELTKRSAAIYDLFMLFVCRVVRLDISSFNDEIAQ